LPALVNLGILLTDSGRRDEAVATWRRALAVDPSNARARRALATLDPTYLPPSPRVPARPRWGDEE
jgi:Tfp pilus assembly protein PilF